MRISDRSGRIGSRGNFCVPLVGAASVFVAASARSQSIGINELRALDPTLNGGGVPVAQAEASSGANPPDFEVNPANSGVNQPASLFTYYSSNGTSTSLGGSVGQESGHADTVASLFYGIPNGVATNVSHVDNYDADFFINNYVSNRVTVPALVINQSFVVVDNMGNPIQDPATDQLYDNYIAAFNKVIVSGAGNFGKPDSPSTAYNDISVGAYGGSTAIGPTLDGRSKPDIVAPAGATSFSTPQVSGAAAILLQAGARGDGGAGTASDSQDFRVIKALLLNGATKPAGWTHTQTAPLDPTYGAGILNVFNSYEQLAGGKHAPITSTSTLTLGGPHAPPTGISGNEPSNIGWDFTTLTMSLSNDNVEHYFFNVASPSTLSALLDWERQDGQATINNLDLYLYDANSGTLIDQSISSVDNVEHLFDQNLPAGRYDLEVLSHGGTIVSPTETYALAYSFAATPEPASGVIMICGLSCIMFRRRVRRT
jgi:hypothetical protein